MKRIELIKTYVDGDTIHYQVREDVGLGLLQKEIVDLFIRYHGDEHYDCDLSKAPNSILNIPISLYLLPITYFFDDVELIIPEMDEVLFNRLPIIYAAYSKVYGPFQEEWRGKLTVKKIVDNTHIETLKKYKKIVFFSGGIDACHAGINNKGKKTLLVSIPDIERDAVDEGPLRNEKYSLLENFSRIVDSDWLLISNNFNKALLREQVVSKYLSYKLKLRSSAYLYDGWRGIRYMADMCCVAPIAYLLGVSSLIMGSAFEQIEDKLLANYDGASPDLSDSIAFCNTSFAEQDGLMIRRTQKVRSIIDWCKSHNNRIKMWVCFSDGRTQCGLCIKCVRTQLNILCAGENPQNWGFENFSSKKLSSFVRSYRYFENNPCWIWDNIETIDDNKIYPYCNDLLHWLKSVGYEQYYARAEELARPTIIKRLLTFNQYPHYIKTIISKLA